MKWTVTCQHLAHALRTIKKVFPPQRATGTTEPGSVLLQAREATITITASNTLFQAMVIVREPVHIATEGCCATSYAALLKAVLALPPESSLTVDCVAGTLAVSAPGYDPASLSSWNGESTPPSNVSMPGAMRTETRGEQTWTYQVEQVQEQRLLIPRSALAGAVSRVAFAAATDPSRPVFRSIFTQVHERTLTLAAASSHWIAEYVVPGVSEVRAWRLNLLLPAKAMQKAVQLLPEGMTEMEATVTTERLILRNGQAVTDADPSLTLALVRLSCEQVTVLLRPVQGTYPAYRFLFQQAWKTRAICPTARLREIVQASAEHTDRRITVRIGGQAITITSLGSGDRPNRRSIEAEVDGTPLAVVLDSRALLAFLKAVPTEKVGMEFTGADRPCRFFSQDEPGQYVYVQMPERK